MGKRSSFERRVLDDYPTPFEAVPPLIPFLDGFTTYAEPCCGEGRLVEHLAQLKPRLQCIWKSDIRDGIDALSIETVPAQLIITNPSWDRSTLHPLIEHLMGLRPTWLLFDADWMHTKQAALLLVKCERIVSVGRLRWIPDTTNTGKDNVAWYLFDRHHRGPTRFHGRVP